MLGMQRSFRIEMSGGSDDPCMYVNNDKVDMVDLSVDLVSKDRNGGLRNKEFIG